MDGDFGPIAITARLDAFRAQMKGKPRGNNHLAREKHAPGKRRRPSGTFLQIGARRLPDQFDDPLPIGRIPVRPAHDAHELRDDRLRSKLPRLLLAGAQEERADKSGDS